MKVYLKMGKVVKLNDVKKITTIFEDRELDFIDKCPVELGRQLLGYCRSCDCGDEEPITFTTCCGDTFVTTTDQIVAIEED